KDGMPHLAGALALDELDLDPTAVALFGDQSFLAGKGGWPTAPFSQKSSLPFTADLDLTTGALAAGPFATAHDASLSLKLDQEGIRVSDLKARLFGGALTGLFELKNNDGTGLFSGQMKLAGADLSALLPNAGLSGSGDVSTALSTSGKSVDAMAAALSGSGTATLRGLTIAGVNPDAFPAFVEKADSIGRDIDAAKTAGFAPEIAANGNFAAKDTEIAFTVAGGTLRAPPISLDNPAATLSADVTANLNASTYRPGDEALVGSEPAVNFSVEGPLGAADRLFDSEPLAQFLTQRALEKEQQRVEAMQAALLEKQRLRREVRYYAALQTERDRAAEELRRQQEEARLQAEAEAKAKAEAEAQARAEAEAKAQAEAEAKAKAEADAKAQAEADAKAKAEAEEKAQAEAGAKAKADAEAKARVEQQAADAAAKAQAEEERRKAEEALRIASEERAKRDAQRKAAQQAPKVDGSLPGVNDGSAPPPPKPKSNPFTIDNLLKSLDGG
ncbi:MAG: AsmA protein, partial [Mesorhizobium sp.]|uniref:AsmA-like C-terminal region-containing protein n=1 Tax=Mesorhizobium sp. TaxID=1871066 RepID=UPI000FE53C2C